MLDTVTRAYSELPFNKEASMKALTLPKEGGGSKLLGTETLNGYVTDKYQTSIRTPTGTRSGTIWIAQKLEVPIKMESDDKLFIQNYKKENLILFNLWSLTEKKTSEVSVI